MEDKLQQDLVEAGKQFRRDVDNLLKEITKIVVGHQHTIEHLLICLFAGGHLLLEGVPGLGKTVLVRTLAETLGLKFSRIQFTPDIMPADIVGANFLVSENFAADETRRHRLEFQPGPIFANIVLADEVNRATPKTQSALLECMQEKSVTVAGNSYFLETPFLVMATQNPLEMEGTFPLPEAQLDRFFFKLILNYPSRLELNEILARTTENSAFTVRKLLSRQRIIDWYHMIRRVYIAPHVQDYAVRLVLATHPQNIGASKLVKRYVNYGASPRGAQSLVIAAKVYACLYGRYNVSFSDILNFAKPALRHRIILNFEGEAEGIQADTIIEEIISQTSQTAKLPEK